MQWSDPEAFAVLRYLVMNCFQELLQLVCVHLSLDIQFKILLSQLFHSCLS